MISFLNEYFSALPDERALLLGIAQTMGATFTAWLPLLIFNTGTQAPVFRKGFITCTVVAVAQIGGVVAMWWLSKRGPALGVENLLDIQSDRDIEEEVVINSDKS